MAWKGFMESEKTVHFYFVVGAASSILKIAKW